MEDVLDAVQKEKEKSFQKGIDVGFKMGLKRAYKENGFVKIHGKPPLVKVTAEIGAKVEYLRDTYTVYEILEKAFNDSCFFEESGAEYLGLIDFIDAVTIGYEVEKEGD